MRGRRKGKRIGPLSGYVAKEQGPGGWCYAARIEKGLTIDELAARARVSRRTIIRIEAGTARSGRRVEWRIRQALGLMGQK